MLSGVSRGVEMHKFARRDEFTHAHLGCQASVWQLHCADLLVDCASFLLRQMKELTTHPRFVQKKTFREETSELDIRGHTCYRGSS